MADFKRMQNICLQNSELSSSIVDEYLIYYAASRNRLDKEMDQRLARFRHIKRKFQPEWINMLKSQYITHRIFKENGLIKKYLNHSEIRGLDKSKLEYLQYQANNPWKFAFSMIAANPAEDFYKMEDVFRGNSFLLYSLGITKTLTEHAAYIWFTLLSFNGECWQSFGPIGAYKSFEPDDIFFFATELNPRIEHDQDLLRDLEKNPVPYMLLLAGANYPPTFHQKDQLVQAISWYDQDDFNAGALEKHFKIEYAHEVYRLTLKKWGKHPHFCTVYYDETKKILLLSSMTDRGYTALAKRLIDYGYDLSDEPDIRINPSMLITAQDILKKKIQLNAYDDLFPVEISEKKNEDIKKINNLMELVMPEINAGRDPDIKSLSRKAGVDENTALEMVKIVMQQLKDLPGKPKN